MKPYVYVIKHVSTKSYYIGVRLANKDTPEDDLFKKYFTSSNDIERLIKTQGLSSFEIVHIRHCPNKEYACRLESKVIKLWHISGAKIMNKHNGNNPLGMVGKQWFTNGVDQVICFPGQEPSGWLCGQSDRHKKLNSEGNKGKGWYNNGLIDAKFYRNDVPDGWSPNRMMTHKDSTKVNISNSLKLAPNNNSIKIWITDGTTQLMHPKTDSIPSGFKRGKLPFSEETKTRMSNSMKGLVRSAEHRANIAKSKTGKSSGMKWYTDGTNNIFQKSHLSIPDGFKIGKTQPKAGKYHHPSKLVSPPLQENS